MREYAWFFVGALLMLMALFNLAVADHSAWGKLVDALGATWGAATMALWAGGKI